MSIAKYIYKTAIDELHSIGTSLSEQKLLIFFILITLGGITYKLELMPPSNISIAAAGPDSGYTELVEASQPYLQKSGVKINVIPSRGSLENLHLISHEKNVDAALIQGGVIPTEQEFSMVVSLGSIGYEPIWIFTHKNSSKKPLSLKDLSKLTMGIGPPQGGTQAVAKKLFELVHVDLSQNKNFKFDAYESNIQDFKAGRLDAIMLISPLASPAVRDLLKNNNFELFNFEYAKAYEKQFSFLKAVVVPAASIDIDRHIPKKDITLVATTTSLVVKKSMHPDLQILLLSSVKKLISESKILFFAQRGEMPSYIDPTFRLSQSAQEFYEGGLPFGLKHFPFAVAGFVDKLWFFLAAVMAILYPLAKINIGHRLTRHHAENLNAYEELFKIRDLMLEIDKMTPEQTRGLLNKINVLSAAISKHKISVGAESDSAIIYMLLSNLEKRLLNHLAYLHSKHVT
jgi:TRAP-type uncharacterized transport system substrate-binding protein